MNLKKEITIKIPNADTKIKVKENLPNSQKESVILLHWQCSITPIRDEKQGWMHELLSAKQLPLQWGVGQGEVHQLSRHSYVLSVVWPFVGMPGRMPTVTSTNPLNWWPRRCAKEVVRTDLGDFPEVLGMINACFDMIEMQGRMPLG